MARRPLGNLRRNSHFAEYGPERRVVGFGNSVSVPEQFRGRLPRGGMVAYRTGPNDCVIEHSRRHGQFAAADFLQRRSARGFFGPW